MENDVYCHTEPLKMTLTASQREVTSAIFKKSMTKIQFILLNWFRMNRNCLFYSISFYRAMHFSAKRGIAIACRLSVCNVGEL